MSTPCLPLPMDDAPDWARENPCPGEWKPAYRLLRALRDYQRLRGRPGIVAGLRRKLATIRHRFWSAVTGADIPLNADRIAGGLVLPHPNGIVIHPEAEIGPNVLLFQQVTVGSGGPRPGVPTLGAWVAVGAGAKILGGVRIGNRARIGANAVVLDDVPEGATAVGIPARIIPPVASQ
jgi:serine O-acetyltransferase